MITQPQDSGAGVIACMGSAYRVTIRRDFGKQVKPEAEQVDGKIFIFRYGWVQDEESMYPGEVAYVANDPDWPADAPAWVSEGDLTLYQEYKDIWTSGVRK